MTISICVVAYNEEKTLPRLLDDILKQDYPAEQIEVLLINSMSTDRTREIMEEFAEHEEYRRVVVMDNPKKRLAPGWNIAIAEFQSDAIVRIDAHARIPKDFISKNVSCLESGEDISGGIRPNLPEEDTPWQQVLLMAEASMFGSSIADYRRSNKKKYVKSMFHAAYRREVFEKAGNYDEQLGRTEDNEIHYRIRKNGFRLCYDPEICSYQYTRSSLRKMMKQKYENGYWVALTLKAYPKCLSLFHFVPFAFVMSILGTSVLAKLGFKIWKRLLFMSYFAVAVGMSIQSVWKKQKHILQIFLPGIFFLLHTSYGVGSLIGFIRLPFWKYDKKY